MKKSIRTGWGIALGLIALFFGSWVIMATLTGNPISVESYDTIESELVKDDYRGTQAFLLGLLLVTVLGIASLIVPLTERKLYRNVLLWGIASFVLLAGIYSGTEPYTFEIGIVEQTEFDKPALPIRGQILFFSIWVVGTISFAVLWLDIRHQRNALLEDEDTVQYEVYDGYEQSLN